METEVKTSTFLMGQVGMDFANVFKAFVGSNYLSISYMFLQSGLLLGALGILAISSMEGYCCNLIVQCKNLAIHKILESRQDWLNSTIEAVENPARYKLRKKVERRLTYSDVAWIAAGKWGSRVVTFMVLFTQFGFCIGYLIFLGNTISKLFPDHIETISFNAWTLGPSSNLTTTSPTTSMLPTTVQNSTVLFSTKIVTEIEPTTSNLAPTAKASALDSVVLLDIARSTAMSINVTSNSSSFDPPSAYYSPLYFIIISILVPLFATLALLRSIRHLGPGSVFANGSIFVGYVAIMVFILMDFEISNTVTLANWSTFPIFIGGVSSAYEGIGVIIPIESSMDHTRKWFQHILSSVILLATLILSTVGILGYLRFGEGTAQTIIWNMPPDTALPVVVYTVVSLGVIFTFPLANFPVIEICEDSLFAEGAVFGPSKKQEEVSNHHNTRSIQSESSPLLHDSHEEELDPEMLEILQQLPVAVSISNEVATWKRNLLRIIIVVLEGALALGLKDDYAYFGSFVGAIGSTTLAFVMPCFLHLMLDRDSSILRKIANTGIIAFGIIGGIVAVYVSVSDIIENYFK